MSLHSTTHRVARNASALYAVQLASFLIPVLEIPILARALGSALYGQILFCQALALTASLVVEYGFNINASQQVAVARENASDLSRLFSQVLLAKVLLALPLLVVLTWAWGSGAVDAYLPTAALLAFVASYFFAFGFSPMWYFQGTEKMAGPAILDVGLRLGGVGLLAYFVRTPADFSLSLAFLAVPPFLNTCLTLLWGRRCTGALKWDLSGAWRQIHHGFHFFIYRSATSLAMSAVPVFLGFTSGKRAVGEFAPPEKLVKGMVSLVTPFLLAAFPVFSRHLGRSGGAGALKAPLLTLAAIAVLAVLGAALGAWMGPWAMKVLLGDGFPGALLIFYVLIFLAPLRILAQSIAMLLLIPAGCSKAVSYASSSLSLVAVLLGSGLSLWYGGIGMAAGLVGVETVLLIVMFALVFQVSRKARLGFMAPNNKLP